MKVLSYAQLETKKYKMLPNLPDRFRLSMGELPEAFIMLIWGHSGNGKSSFVMQLVNVLCQYAKVLYVGLEEGHERSMQRNATKHLEPENAKGMVLFADHGMTYDALVKRLKKKRSEKYIVIDSIQYWHITYEQYQALKEQFPSKGFIFISHAKGQIPYGATANAIRYDAGLKIHVTGYVADVVSRYGGNKPLVIWDEGAKKYWGEKLKKKLR